MFEVRVRVHQTYVNPELERLRKVVAPSARPVVAQKAPFVEHADVALVSNFTHLRSGSDDTQLRSSDGHHEMPH